MAKVSVTPFSVAVMLPDVVAIKAIGSAAASKLRFKIEPASEAKLGPVTTETLVKSVVAITLLLWAADSQASQGSRGAWR